MSSPLGGLPLPPLFFDPKTQQFTPGWQGWLSIAQYILQDVSNSGTTAQRPTMNMYIGKPYFDTTLGLPIWVQSVNPVVWITAAGAVV